MPGIQKTVDILRDEDKPISAEAIRSLSDLNAAEMLIFQSQWETIPTERRLKLMSELADVSETNFDLNFSNVARNALSDPDDEVRRRAIDALWYDEDPKLLRLLTGLVRNDPSDEVRADAMSEIGRFILQGELGKLSASLAKEAQDLAISIYNNVDESPEVRRRAIEAIGNCTRSGVAEMIQEAYESDDPRMRASAVHAMGRSCDSDWAEVVLEELRSDEPELRFEAARAAGELELSEAIPTLSFLLEDEDPEIRESAVWALGEIGGNAARHLLETAMERADLANDESMMDAIEEALETANLIGEDILFDD